MQVFDDISKPDMWLKENGIALCVLIDEVAWEDFLLFVAFSCKYRWFCLMAVWVLVTDFSLWFVFCYDLKICVYRKQNIWRVALVKSYAGFENWIWIDEGSRKD